MKNFRLFLTFLLVSFFVGNVMAQNPNVLPGEGKGDNCNCTSKGAVNISTGFNNTSSTIINGQPDPEYKLVSTPNGSSEANISSTSNIAAWASSNAASTWIKPANSTAIGDYVYEYNFNVPNGYTATLRFRRIGADNDVKVSLDGTQIYTSNQNNYAFMETRATLTNCLVVPVATAGNHTLSYRVYNQNLQTGLIVEACMDLKEDCKIPDAKCNPDFTYSLNTSSTGNVVVEARPIVAAGVQHYWGLLPANGPNDTTPISLSTIMNGGTFGLSILSNGQTTPIGQGTNITAGSGRWGYNYGGLALGKCYKITHYVKCCEKWYRITKVFCSKLCTDGGESKLEELSAKELSELSNPGRG